jgi:hypothetical protein
MTWLLKLYPPAWRRRYGDEFLELVGAQRFSFGNAIDVMAGAIDAWIHPQMSAMVPRAPTEGGEPNMLARMKFRCAGYGPNVSATDQWKSLAAMLAGTVVLTLGWMWAHRQMGDNPYVDSLSLMPFLAAMLFSLRYTYLKERSAATQAVFVAGNVLLLTAFFLVVGWISARL